MLVELRSQLTAGGGSAGVPAATVSTSIPWDLSVPLREPLILKPGTKIALVNVLLTSDGSLDSWTVPAAGYQFSFVIGSAMLTPIVVTVAGGIYTGAAFATALTTQMQAAFGAIPRLVTQLNVADCEWRWVPPVSAGADGNFVLDLEWEAGGETDMTDTLVQFNPLGSLETATASLPPAYDSQQASYINGTIYKKTGFLSDDWNTAASPAVGVNVAAPTSTMDTRLTHPLHPYLLGSKSTPKRESPQGYFSCTLAAPSPGEEYSIDLNVSGDATAIVGYRLPAGNQQGAVSALYGWQSTAADDTVTVPVEVYQFESYVGDNDFDYGVYLKIDDGTGVWGFSEKMYLHSATKFVGLPGGPSSYYVYATDRAVALTAAGQREADGLFSLDVEHVNAVIAGVRPRLSWTWVQPALSQVGAANELPELEISSAAGNFTQDWAVNTSTFVRATPPGAAKYNFVETDSGGFTRWWVLQPTYLNHGRGGLADVDGGLLGVAGTSTFSVYSADPTTYQSVPSEIWVLSGEAELTCAQVFPTPGRAGIVAGSKLTAAAVAGPIELTGQQWPWVGWGKEQYCQSVNGNVPIQLDSWSAIIKNARVANVDPASKEALTISLAYKGEVYRAGDGAGEERYTGDQFRWVVKSLDEEGATEDGYLPFCEVTSKESSQNADPKTWVWEALADAPPATAETIDSRDLVYCGITAPGTLKMRLGIGYDPAELETTTGEDGMVRYPGDFTHQWVGASSARVNEVAGTGGFLIGDVLVASHVQASTQGKDRRYVVHGLSEGTGQSNRVTFSDLIIATPGAGYANGDVVRFFCLRDPRIQVDLGIATVGHTGVVFTPGTAYTVGGRYSVANGSGEGAVLVARAADFSIFDVEDPGVGFAAGDTVAPDINLAGGVHPIADRATIQLGPVSHPAISWSQLWLGTLRTLNREWGLPGDTGYGARDAMTPQNKCVIETAVGANGGVRVVVGDGTVADGTPESEWIEEPTQFGVKHPFQIEATGAEVDAPNANNSEILVQLPSFPIDSRNAAGYSDNHIAAVPFEQSSNAAGANKSWVQPYSLLYQRTCNNQDLTINEVKVRFTDWRGRPRTDLIHPTGVTLSVQPDSL